MSNQRSDGRLLATMPMEVYALDHVQVAMPEGREEDARAFYRDLLRLKELQKPAALAKRGGAWFGGGTFQIHVGVEQDFRPARKAHPALLVRGLEELVRRCEAAGHETSKDDLLPGYTRFYVHDPFGNRIELMEQIG